MLSLIVLAACDGSRVERDVGIVESDSPLGEEVLSASATAQAGVPSEISNTDVTGSAMYGQAVVERAITAE